jgi:replicative superfamily II helicase
MQAGKTYGPLVLANRYDGIDLAGNACRFLIMDNLPQGTTNYDVFRTNVVADSAANSLLAQRIEQGIGRGTRGGADYCAIVLVGSKLVGWIGRKKNLDFLTASTRAQLKMGHEVSEAISTVQELTQTIRKCLDRDLIGSPIMLPNSPTRHTRRPLTRCRLRSPQWSARPSDSSG